MHELRRAVVVLVAMGGMAPLTAQQPPRFTERVAVSRVLVDVRVLDSRSGPIRGLTPDDFAVRVGGRTARVESVQWVGPAAEPFGAATRRHVIGDAPGNDRLIVFLVQLSFERGRMRGLMRTLAEVHALLGTFTPTDRVAVLSFDSQLKIWLDFTRDVARVRGVLDARTLPGSPRPAQPSAGPSLFPRLTPEVAGQTHSIELSLLRLGEALEPLPGAKTIVFVGHGFGQYGRTGLALPRAYDEARHALLRARTSVFTVDVTTADEHSLEAALRLVSGDTGGLFVATHLFPRRALRSIAQAIAGHYVLFLEPPPVGPGTHPLVVDVSRPATVLAQATLVLSH